MTITISKEEFNSLLKTKAEAETLKNKVAELTEEAKNKAVALDEERKKTKAKAEEFKQNFSEKEAELENLKKLFDLKENENLEEKIKSLKENDSKYSEILKQKEAERKENIDKYKTFLGEDFMKEKASFFEGLSDEKTEILLKDYAESKGFGKDENGKPKIDLTQDGSGGGSEVSDFDKLYSAGASSSDLIKSLD